MGAIFRTFFAGYVLNIFYITVLYHRGLAHGAVKLRPWIYRWTMTTGIWITGLDPKAWVCMHRLHHQHSDTELDPHSPEYLGIVGVLFGQFSSYKKVVHGLKTGDVKYSDVVSDLEFPVHWLHRNEWSAWVPYLLQGVFAGALAFVFKSAFLGVAYWLGVMSHPVQGWMVNSFAHRFGYRNHPVNDESRNNTIVAILVMGEGYQNNHHANPRSAKFSERWFEFDPGYFLCWLASRTGFVQIERS